MIPLHQLNFFVVCIRYLLTIPGATADEDIALRYVYLVYRRPIHLQGQWEEPSSLAKQDNLFKYLDKDVAYISSLQLISVPQLCPTSCEPMDCSMPGFPVHYQLTDCSNSCPSIHWCQPTISSSFVPFSSGLQSFPASGSFPMSQFFASGDQSIGVSASASVIPKNIQDLFPLGWTGWISLQSKGLSRVFSNTTVQKHQFFGAQLSSQSNSHIHTWPLEKP